MSSFAASHRLDRPVDKTQDHILGPDNAEITLVEYGSYGCPHCRAANDRIADIRDRFGDRLRYVFRHRPVTGSDLARRAAELAECVEDPERFWDAHNELMSRSAALSEEDIAAVREGFALQPEGPLGERARRHVEDDMASARASGVMITPTFFINGRRYDGPWDESSFADAMVGSLGHRVRAAALDFASWAPSTGMLLLFATILAVVLTNSPWGGAFEALWTQYFGFSLDDGAFRMSVRHWINDGLLSVFFMVVGLEIKREFTIGHLASARSAALPIAGAIGGMAVPALFYILLIPAGDWSEGWGVPMATDTAFAVALIVMMGARVPVELRIFLTAAAIVDDIGAILVVAVFYSGDLNFYYLGGALGLVALLALLNRAGIYRVLPYLLVGVLLWACVYGGGLHATLAGVLLAMFIPTRPPANLKALMVQANTIIAAEARRGGGAVLRHGPSTPALRALDAIHDRIESPADRTLRHVEPWSSYFVLPLFALANAGVLIELDVFSGREALMAAIAAGLVLGKPIGMISAAALAVALKLAIKPQEYGWGQLAGAGALAGIGFTMSLFIAGQAFPAAADFSAAKVAIFAASILAAAAGVAVLWIASRRAGAES